MNVFMYLLKKDLKNVFLLFNINDYLDNKIYLKN